MSPSDIGVPITDALLSFGVEPDVGRTDLSMRVYGIIDVLCVIWPEEDIGLWPDPTCMTDS